MQQVGVDPQAGLNAGQRSILRRFRVKVAQKAGLHLRRKRHRHREQRAVAGVLHQNDVRELLRKGIGMQPIEALARVLLPEIQAFFESEDGQREFAEWKAKQQAEQENKT